MKNCSFQFDQKHLMSHWQCQFDTNVLHRQYVQVIKCVRVYFSNVIQTNILLVYLLLLSLAVDCWILIINLFVCLFNTRFKMKGKKFYNVLQTGNCCCDESLVSLSLPIYESTRPTKNQPASCSPKLLKTLFHPRAYFIICRIRQGGVPICHKHFKDKLASLKVS